MLPGAWIFLFPLEELAGDISPDLPAQRAGFSGFTLAFDLRNREHMVAILEHARSAVVRVVKEAQDTFWGGFSGYFADVDGYYWEVVWGPMFEFGPDGALTPSASCR